MARSSRPMSSAELPNYQVFDERRYFVAGQETVRV